jgi:ABC-2 type transport system permease protein
MSGSMDAGGKVMTAPGGAFKVEKGSVGQWSQFQGLFFREMIKTFRNPWVIIITVVQPFMWLAFFGSSFASVPGWIGTLKTIFCGTDATCYQNLKSYTQFLLPGVLSTSMLAIGMFGSMSTIQDKRFGFMKRILITPTQRSTVYLAKALGSATRGLVQIPVMVVAALLFGVTFMGDPLMWAGWVLAMFLLGFGTCCMFLALTASSTDWQTPGVISNFITMPLMFASAAMFPITNYPTWMQYIAKWNPVTYCALFGRGVVVDGTANWIYLGYLAIFTTLMAVIGTAVASRYLKAE